VKSNGISTGIRFAPVLCAYALTLLSACGGGGGGGAIPPPPPPPPPPPAALTFAPTTATVSAQAGISGMATLTATPASGLPSPLYAKITGSPTVVTPNLGFTANADGTYSLSLQSSTSLTQGSYSGNLSVAVCSDVACTVPVAGSPVSLRVHDHGGTTISGFYPHPCHAERDLHRGNAAGPLGDAHPRANLHRGAVCAGIARGSRTITNLDYRNRRWGIHRFIAAAHDSRAWTSKRNVGAQSLL